MNPQLRIAFETELNEARHCYARGDYDGCYRHLERAHILGQRWYLPHVRSHYWMFRVGLKMRDRREIAGQLLRIAASVGSLLGVVPIGNTGRARVPALKPMPIPEDLRRFFAD